MRYEREKRQKIDFSWGNPYSASLPASMYSRLRDLTVWCSLTALLHVCVCVYSQLERVETEFVWHSENQ